MKKIKFIICSFALALIVAVSTSSSVFAASTVQPHQSDFPQPRALCSFCGNTAYITCWGDKTRDYRSTHSYGLGKTCTFTSYVSRSSLHCYFCNQNSEIYGNHECWEVHASCGKEYYRVCTCQVKDEW